MNLQPSVIVGAGLAGLLAAHAWPSCPIVESSAEPRAEHKALLRFRSDAVSRLTGIEFKPVTVRKGIWSRSEFRPPSIALANSYSAKVTGRLLGDRSIWNIEPVTRYIAPESFYDELVENVMGRINWGTRADFNVSKRVPILSTAPMPVHISELFLPVIKFERAPINVYRYRVPGADLYQTIYFPDEDNVFYRASMTGDLLIVEGMARAAGPNNPAVKIADSLSEIEEAFGETIIHEGSQLDVTRQEYGKIVDLDPTVRKSILFKLTHDFGIYSLGRFATWRNILLDDVVDDIAVIKRLLRTGDKYDVARARAS